MVLFKKIGAIMKMFIYYNYSKEEKSEVDVAVVRAESRKEAVKILKKYYSNVRNENLQKLDFKDYEGKDVDIMIISDY